jgi:hypothetical protein
MILNRLLSPGKSATIELKPCPAVGTERGDA